MTWFVSDFDISFLCERIYIRRSVNRLNTSSEVGNRKVIQQRRGLHNAVRFQKRPVHLSSDLLRRAMANGESGVGVSVAANEFPGIRASLCHDTYSARQGVEHDDMNVLCIGARVIGPESAFEVVRSFLSARYAPAPRHAARLAKIVDIERRVLSGEFSNGQNQS